jgi:hypothetical protein
VRSRFSIPASDIRLVLAGSQPLTLKAALAATLTFPDRLSTNANPENTINAVIKARKA